MADLAWLNDPKMVIALICGSSGLGVFITWTYYSRQLRHLTEQLEEQKRLNAVQIEKMQLESKNLQIDLDTKKGRALQIPTLEQVEKYSPVDGRVAYAIRFLSDRAFANQLKADSSITHGEISIKRIQAEHDPTALQFGINDVTSITTEIVDAFYAGELAARLLRWMRESKSSRVIIQTPLRSVEFGSGSPPTEDELRQLLLQGLEP